MQHFLDWRHGASFLAGLMFWLAIPIHASAQAWRSQFPTPFEQSDGWETADYASVIHYYQQLAKNSPAVSMHAMGSTDSGKPLHLVLIASGPPCEPASICDDARSVLFVINAIHPGEPDGVDASMAFARDLAFDHTTYDTLLKDVIVAIVPVYNIGGALNRNSSTRANQNGPREYGFRGNARNFDLNRDFVKCDTANARSFAQIFQLLDPELFIDTHVTNGADYQHVMTTSHSQSDKLGQQLGTYLRETFETKLFAGLQQAGFPTIPYVNSGGKPPQDGFPQFLETPRYSTGYAALFQTIGFMSETHMLKPFPQRVRATREFLDQALKLLALEGQSIQTMRRSDRESYHRQQSVPIEWSVDLNRPSRLEFHGFEAEYVNSEITPGTRLFYDRERPYIRNIRYFNRYNASRSVKLPAGYLIPQQWQSVIELLKLNRVEMSVVQDEQSLPAECYRIEKVESRSMPYEGHFFHDTVKVTISEEEAIAKPGDVIVPIAQDRARYVVETLEPEAMDSLFRWNFFDSILQRKEYFSAYIFEDTAEAMLASDRRLRDEFVARKEADSDFANDRQAQLMFLYERSPHAETSYRRYPVMRLRSLPIERVK
jgi:hypothetical protein